jgi:hypothetical protein
LENNQLVVDGLPQVWPHTRLTATSAYTFDIDSLPFALTFATDIVGVVDSIIVTIPEFLSGHVAANKVNAREQRIGKQATADLIALEGEQLVSGRD